MNNKNREKKKRISIHLTEDVDKLLVDYIKTIHPELHVTKSQALNELIKKAIKKNLLNKDLENKK